jgi:NitT/TauT family transport system substrate-binding protein
MKSSLSRGILAALAALMALAVLRFKPWQKPEGENGGDTASSNTTLSPTGKIAKNLDTRPELEVGFLPVTCHLTCPVTDFASKTSGKNRFVSKRFTDFPTVVDALKSGNIDATFMIAPLAMKIREQGTRVHIVYLGHRDGSTVMVRKDLKATSLRDLKGKTFAIPSRFSNQNLVIHKLMERQGLKPDD